MKVGKMNEHRKSSSADTDLALAIACCHFRPWVVINSTTPSYFSWPLRSAHFPADDEQPVSGQMVCWTCLLSVYCSFQTAAVLSGTSTQLCVTQCRVTTGPVSPPLLFLSAGVYGMTWAAWSSFPFGARPPLIWYVTSFLSLALSANKMICTIAA